MGVNGCLYLDPASLAIVARLGLSRNTNHCAPMLLIGVDDGVEKYDANNKFSKDDNERDRSGRPCLLVTLGASKGG